MLLAFACGDDDAERTPRQQLAELELEAGGAIGTTRGVSLALEAAGLHDDLDEGGRERVLAMLERAAEDPSVPRACEAALRRASLIRDASAEEAYLEAYRIRRRFEGPPSCVEQTEALLGELAGARPPAGVLAAIDRAEGRALEPCRLERVEVMGAGSQAVRVVLYMDESRERCPFRTTSDDTSGQRALEIDFGPLEVDGSVPEEVAVDEGGLRRVVRRDTEGSARVRMELEDDALATAFQLGGPSRVVVDVEAGRRVPDTDVRVVVLDPGHGGREIGGHYEELVESTLVMDIARRCKAVLEPGLPDSRVLLTREGDVQMSLEARTAMANSVEADVFVSIHLNALDEPVQHTGGVTTFVLDTRDETQAVELAARENGTRAYEVTDMQRLLAGLHRREQVRESRRLAGLVQGSVLRSGRAVLPELADRGVRSQVFYVLVGARMPAVLVEASFMDRPDEAAALRTEAYRQKLAEGIAEGILRYARGDLASPTTPGR